MALASTTLPKTIISHSEPVTLTAAEAIEAGDLVTADGYKADADNSRYADFVACRGVATGERFQAAREATIEGPTGGGGAGTALYLSDVAGDISESVGTVSQTIGVELSATRFYLAPTWVAASGAGLLGDGVYQYFGNSNDIAMGWDGTNFIILPAANDSGAFLIGDGSADIDLKIFLGATTKYAEFNVGDSQVNLEDVDLHLGDNDALEFGDATSGDVYMAWDTDSLNILPATDDTGAIEVGNGTFDIDLKIFLSSTSVYYLFDVGNKQLTGTSTLTSQTTENNILDITLSTDSSWITGTNITYSGARASSALKITATHGGTTGGMHSIYSLLTGSNNYASANHGMIGTKGVVLTEDTAVTEGEYMAAQYIMKKAGSGTAATGAIYYGLEAWVYLTGTSVVGTIIGANFGYHAETDQDCSASGTVWRALQVFCDNVASDGYNAEETTGVYIWPHSGTSDQALAIGTGTGLWTTGIRFVGPGSAAMTTGIYFGGTSAAGSSDLQITTAISIAECTGMVTGISIAATCSTAAIQVGTNGSGAGDVIFYGETTGSNLTWDEDSDALELTNSKLEILTTDDKIAAFNAIYSYIDTGGDTGWTSGNVVAGRFKVNVDHTAGTVSGLTAGWFGMEMATGYAATQNGLRVVVNIEAVSVVANSPTALLYLQSLPGVGADFSTMPYLVFSETPGGTGSNILFEVGSEPAGTTCTIGSGKLYHGESLQVKVNTGARYIPLLTTQQDINTWTTSTHTLYVDVIQTASGNVGTPNNPYTTIMAAVNAIIAATDNTDAVTYTIYIAPGTYTETVTLENAELANIAFISLGGPAKDGYTVGTGGVVLDPSGANALESEGTNSALHYLYFFGIHFKGNIILDGVDNDTYFGEKGIIFDQCGIDDGSTACTLSVKACEKFTWRNCFMNRKSVLTVENAWSFEICGEGTSDWPMNMSGASTLTADTAQAMPYHMNDDHQGGDQMSFKIDHAFVQRSSWTLAQGGDGVLMISVINGWMSGDLTLPAKANLYGYTGYFNGDVTLNGATNSVFLYNTAIKGDLTENGCSKTVVPSET